MAKELARVTDVAALDAQRGPVARLIISVPAPWTTQATRLVVDAPAVLPCERCQGGGCDSCGRSGAHRAPADPAEREVHLTLPTGIEGGTLVRVPRPFEASAIQQLIVEVRVAAAPSEGVTRVPSVRSTSAASPSPAVAIGLLVIALVVIGTLIAL
jgi:hypothetical protein